ARARAEPERDQRPRRAAARISRTTPAHATTMPRTLARELPRATRVRARSARPAVTAWLPTKRWHPRESRNAGALAQLLQQRRQPAAVMRLIVDDLHHRRATRDAVLAPQGDAEAAVRRVGDLVPEPRGPALELVVHACARRAQLVEVGVQLVGRSLHRHGS